MASTGEVWKLGHRPALDGVRGIAILLVVAGHLFVPGINDQGKIGVAVFFTLSGFLITSLLLDEHSRTGRIELRRFYIRRLLRLAPAQMVCIGVVALVGLPLGAVYLTGSQALLSAAYLANVIDPGGLLGHFWSLAVEEQFYLLWAPGLVVLLRRDRRILLLVCVVGAAGSFAARLLLGDVAAAGVTVPHLLPLQADALLVGCALAVWMAGRREGRGRPGLAAAGVAGLLALCVLPVQVAGTVGIFAAALVTAAVLYAVSQGPRVRGLSSPVLTLIGRRSYAVYLWHYPVLVMAVAFGVGRFDWITLSLVVVPVTTVLTAVSWRFVESPFLRLRRDRAEVLRPELEGRCGGGVELLRGADPVLVAQPQGNGAAADVARG